jgi:hypothetical protein
MPDDVEAGFAGIEFGTVRWQGGEVKAGLIEYYDQPAWPPLSAEASYGPETMETVRVELSQPPSPSHQRIRGPGGIEWSSFPLTMLAGWCGAICRRASNHAIGRREAFLRGAEQLATRPRRWDNPESLHQPEQIGLAPALDQLTAFDPPHVWEGRRRGLSPGVQLWSNNGLPPPSLRHQSGR